MNLPLKIRILERFPCQADFAKVAGLSESTLSRIVRGRLEPGFPVKETIAKKLGCSPDELFPMVEG